MDDTNIKNMEARLKRIQDYKELWDIPSGAGKRVLLGLIDESKAMGDPQSNSGQAMAYNVGKASLGKEIIDNIVFAGIDLSTRESLGKTEQDVKDYRQEAITIIKNGGKQDVRTRFRNS